MDNKKLGLTYIFSSGIFMALYAVFWFYPELDLNIIPLLTWPFLIIALFYFFYGIKIFKKLEVNDIKLINELDIKQNNQEEGKKDFKSFITSISNSKILKTSTITLLILMAVQFIVYPYYDSPFIKTTLTLLNISISLYIATKLAVKSFEDVLNSSAFKYSLFFVVIFIFIFPNIPYLYLVSFPLYGLVWNIIYTTLTIYAILKLIEISLKKQNTKNNSKTKKSYALISNIIVIPFILFYSVFFSSVNNISGFGGLTVLVLTGFAIISYFTITILIYLFEGGRENIASRLKNIIPIVLIIIAFISLLNPITALISFSSFLIYFVLIRDRNKA